MRHETSRAVKENKTEFLKRININKIPMPVEPLIKLTKESEKVISCCLRVKNQGGKNEIYGGTNLRSARKQASRNTPDQRNIMDTTSGFVSLTKNYKLENYTSLPLSLSLLFIFGEELGHAEIFFPPFAKLESKLHSQLDSSIENQEIVKLITRGNRESLNINLWRGTYSTPDTTANVGDLYTISI